MMHLAVEMFSSNLNVNALNKMFSIIHAVIHISNDEPTAITCGTCTLYVSYYVV